MHDIQPIQNLKRIQKLLEDIERSFFFQMMFLTQQLH